MNQKIILRKYSFDVNYSKNGHKRHMNWTKLLLIYLHFFYFYHSLFQITFLLNSWLFHFDLLFLSTTSVELVSVGGARCNVYDAGDIRFSGIKVDGLVREPESVSLARGRASPDSDQNGESPDSDHILEEDEDSGAEPDLPPGGQF